MELQTVYRQELPALYALLVRLGASRSDLEDLAHDIFMVAMRRWATYDRARPVRPWLAGIAWRVFSDHHQRRRPELMEEPPEVEVEPDEPIERRDAQRQVQAALARLDDVKRATFVMHQLQELTVAEISEVMEVPVQTTYSRLRAAREEFAAAIRRLARGES